MSVSEDMMREQLARIIARVELRIEQQCLHASALAPYGDGVKRARSELALMLTGLAKLKTLLGEVRGVDWEASDATSLSRFRVFILSPARLRLLILLTDLRSSRRVSPRAHI